MNSSELNSLLEQLGLTEYESKTLSTLFKLQEADAPAISRLAQVPKTRVYDVLDKLVEKSLVIEIRGRPKRYRSVEARKSMDGLIATKQQELEQLSRRVSELQQSLSTIGSEKEAAGETVMKVKDRHDFERILAQEISRAKSTLVGFAEITDKQHVLREAIEKAKERNVAVKVINAYSTDWLKKAASESKQFEHGLNAFIIDSKKVILALSDFKRERPDYHFTIFHQHKPMANALQHYFDKVWQQAKK